MAACIHIGSGYTVIFTSQKSGMDTYLPVLVLKKLGTEVQRLIMKHLPFSSADDASKIAKLSYLRLITRRTGG